MIKNYGTLSAFFEEQLNFLEQEEALNNKLLGTLWELQKQEESSVPLLLSYQEEAGRICVVKRGNGMLMIYGDELALDKGIPSIINYLREGEIQFSRVHAPVKTANVFAREWTAQTKEKMQKEMDSSAYCLRKLQSNIRISSGEWRMAKEEDLATCKLFMEAFFKEALGTKSKEQASGAAVAMINKNRMYLWLDKQEIVCMASVTRKLRRGVAISYVYTPELSRGKGYARSLMAGMSQDILKQGYEFCSLFADKTNPASNHVYKTVGYEVLGDLRSWMFV